MGLLKKLMKSAIDINKWAITISPPPRVGSETYKYNNDIYHIKRQLNKVSDKYCIYPEYSVGSRLHYHGVIIIKDWVKWHKSVHRRLQSYTGYIKIEQLKTVKDLLTWNVYIRKGWWLTQNILEIDKPIIVSNLKRRIIKKEIEKINLTNYFQ